MGELLRSTAEQVKDPEILKSYRPYFERPAGEATSRFLTSFGLDLLEDHQQEIYFKQQLYLQKDLLNNYTKTLMNED
jgi:hypothetical protein